MNQIIFRKGARVILRPLEHADIPFFLKWMNDPGTTQYLMRSFPLMEKEEVEWIDKLVGDRSNVALGIVDAETGKLIGSMGLHQINWVHRTAETGTLIGEERCRSRGYGTEAKELRTCSRSHRDPKCPKIRANIVYFEEVNDHSSTRNTRCAAVFWDTTTRNKSI